MRSGHFIDGKELGHKGPFFGVIDPSTREIMGHAALGEGKDIDRAVQAARQKPDWWFGTLCH